MPRPSTRALVIALVLAQLSRPAAAQSPEASASRDAAAAIPEPIAGPLSIAGARGLDPDGMVAGEDAAYERYMAGRKAYDAGDAAAAAEAFVAALRRLPELPPYVRSRGSLALAWAQCEARLYLERGDLDHLARERSILAAYLGRVDEIGRDQADRAAKRALVTTRMAEIEAEFARLTGDHGDAETQIARSLEGEYAGVQQSAWAPRVEDLAWHRRRDDPRARARQLTEAERAGLDAGRGDDGEARRPGTAMIATGATVLAIGVGALAVMGVGMARAKAADDFSPTQSPDARRQQIERGTAGNAMAVAGAAVGAAAVITGAVLVGLGVKKRRGAARLELAPTVVRGGGGLVLGGSF